MESKISWFDSALNGTVSKNDLTPLQQSVLDEYTDLKNFVQTILEKHKPYVFIPNINGHRYARRKLNFEQELNAVKLHINKNPNDEHHLEESINLIADKKNDIFEVDTMLENLEAFHDSHGFLKKTFFAGSIRNKFFENNKKTIMDIVGKPPSLPQENQDDSALSSSILVDPKDTERLGEKLKEARALFEKYKDGKPRPNEKVKYDKEITQIPPILDEIEANTKTQSASYIEEATNYLTDIIQWLQYWIENMEYNVRFEQEFEEFKADYSMNRLEYNPNLRYKFIEERLKAVSARLEDIKTNLEPVVPSIGDSYTDSEDKFSSNYQTPENEYGRYMEVSTTTTALDLCYPVNTYGIGIVCDNPDKILLDLTHIFAENFTFYIYSPVLQIIFIDSPRCPINIVIKDQSGSSSHKNIIIKLTPETLLTNAPHYPKTIQLWVAVSSINRYISVAEKCTIVEYGNATSSLDMKFYPDFVYPDFDLSAVKKLIRRHGNNNKKYTIFAPFDAILWEDPVRILQKERTNQEYILTGIVDMLDTNGFFPTLPVPSLQITILKGPPNSYKRENSINIERIMGRIRIEIDSRIDHINLFVQRNRIYKNYPISIKRTVDNKNSTNDDSAPVLKIAIIFFSETTCSANFEIRKINTEFSIDYMSIKRT